MVLSLYIHKITHKHQLPISVLIYDDKCLFVVPEESRLLYFPVYIFFISSPSRHSQTESPTSWLAATWALSRSLVAFWCVCTAEWPSSTWTGTGRWKCSRSSTLTGVVHRSTAASRMASVTSLFEEQCWMMSCSGSPPSTGLCQKSFYICIYFIYSFHVVTMYVYLEQTCSSIW